MQKRGGGVGTKNNYGRLVCPDSTLRVFILYNNMNGAN